MDSYDEPHAVGIGFEEAAVVAGEDGAEIELFVLGVYAGRPKLEPSIVGLTSACDVKAVDSGCVALSDDEPVAIASED